MGGQIRSRHQYGGAKLLTFQQNHNTSIAISVPKGGQTPLPISMGGHGRICPSLHPPLGLSLGRDPILLNLGIDSVVRWYASSHFLSRRGAKLHCQFRWGGHGRICPSLHPPLGLSLGRDPILLNLRIDSVVRWYASSHSKQRREKVVYLVAE